MDAARTFSALKILRLSVAVPSSARAREVDNESLTAHFSLFLSLFLSLSLSLSLSFSLTFSLKTIEEVRQLAGQRW